jgi:hypothetical protein
VRDVNPPKPTQISLLTNNNARYGRKTTKVDYFVVDNANHVERSAGGDRVNEDIAMNTNSVFVVQYGVFVL